ncbi:unnamed protein product [Arctia plantaginis]|uniref:Gustatory receptor n=1 Tax=Arctia plantaginis TaxID=874455 RepID=A0A8S1A9P4_ARCPL|nr:unnamed protein product [Arctia plantaginis]
MVDATDLETECVVSGTLYFVLQISRLAGTSPVKFERVNGGWRICVSLIYYVYCCVVQIVLAVGIGIFVIDRDNIVDGYEASHNTGFMRIILIIYFVVHVMSGAAIAFTGLDRMRHMIDCKARLQWINAEIDGLLRPSKSNERTMFLIIIAILVFGYYAVSFEYGVYISDLLHAHVTVPQSFEFAHVNEETKSNEGNPIPNHVISCAIDSLPVNVKRRTNNGLKTDPATLERLIEAYCSMCGIIRQLNDSNGFALLLMLLFIFIELLTAPYFAVAIIFVDDEETDPSDEAPHAQGSRTSFGPTQNVLQTHPAQPSVCIGIYSIDREEVVDGYEASHNTGFMRIILIIYFVVHVMSGAAIAVTGLDRMRHMIDCKARLQWINAEIDGFLRPSKSNEKTMFLIVIATLVFGYYAVSFEYGVYFSDLITAHVTVSQFDVNQQKESNEGNSIPNHMISCGIDSLPVIVRQVVDDGDTDPPDEAPHAQGSCRSFGQTQIVLQTHPAQPRMLCSPQLDDI